MVATDQVNGEILSLLKNNFVDPASLNEWIVRGHGRKMAQALKINDNNRINDLLNLLGISHTQRFTKEQIEYYHLLDAYASAGIRTQIRSIFPDGVVSYAGIGILVVTSLNHFFISSIVPDSPAEKANLLVGDELVSVGDKPYEPTVSFYGREGCNLVVGFRRKPYGKICHVKLAPKMLAPGNMLRYAARKCARVILNRPISVGYYKPWSLAGASHWQQMKGILSEQLKDVDALVLDLRGCIGGASPDYAEFFIGRSPELIYKSPIRTTKIINPHWRKPVVVIVDESTCSGNEVFAFALQRSGIPIVGTRSAGHVTAAMPFILSDNSLLLVATYLVQIDGETLEGKGVWPDLPIVNDIKYCAGRDTQLERALGLLLGHI